MGYTVGQIKALYEALQAKQARQRLFAVDDLTAAIAGVLSSKGAEHLEKHLKQLQKAAQ